MTESSYWGVAVTRPNYEKFVQDRLHLQNVDSYLPRIKTNGRPTPLFTRYIFVRLANPWHVVVRTLGVVDLLRNGMKPASVPDVVIDGLRAREDRHGFVQLPARLTIGARVRVIRGPFAGQVGLYKGMSSKQRESVLLAALGCKLDMAIGNLEVAE